MLCRYSHINNNRIGRNFRRYNVSNTNTRTIWATRNQNPLYCLQCRQSIYSTQRRSTSHIIRNSMAQPSAIALYYMRDAYWWTTTPRTALNLYMLRAAIECQRTQLPIVKGVVNKCACVPRLCCSSWHKAGRLGFQANSGAKVEEFYCASISGVTFGIYEYIVRFMHKYLWLMILRKSCGYRFWSEAIRKRALAQFFLHQRQI